MDYSHVWTIADTGTHAGANNASLGTIEHDMTSRCDGRKENTISTVIPTHEQQTTLRRKRSPVGLSTLVTFTHARSKIMSTQREPLSTLSTHSSSVPLVKATEIVPESLWRIWTTRGTCHIVRNYIDGSFVPTYISANQTWQGCPHGELEQAIECFYAWYMENYS